MIVTVSFCDGNAGVTDKIWANAFNGSSAEAKSSVVIPRFIRLHLSLWCRDP
jgi:hypothetical protein